MAYYSTYHFDDPTQRHRVMVTGTMRAADDCYSIETCADENKSLHRHGFGRKLYLLTMVAGRCSVYANCREIV